MELERDQQMVSDVFVVVQAAQTEYLFKIYVSVSATEADAKGNTYNPLKTSDFTPFLKY